MKEIQNKQKKALINFRGFHLGGQLMSVERKPEERSQKFKLDLEFHIYFTYWSLELLFFQPFLAMFKNAHSNAKHLQRPSICVRVKILTDKLFM